MSDFCHCVDSYCIAIILQSMVVKVYALELSNQNNFYDGCIMYILTFSNLSGSIFIDHFLHRLKCSPMILCKINKAWISYWLNNKF